MTNNAIDSTTTPIIVEGSSTIVASLQIDTYHPCLLASSDNLRMVLLNVTFDGNCYENWRRGVLISLSAKNKLGFINGTSKCTAEDSSLLDQWKRCNDMVIAWLLNSLIREISESILYSQTAREL
ncbi:hypothetical protein KY289_036671 [Solanum tuberosum]|nr:hypothetical protein KY289_036671 [Solanum tuberosum]